MPAQTKTQIIAEIDAYMQSVGGQNKNWYVGIASEPRKRLFEDHNVSEKTGRYIARQALSEQAARDIEAAYHKIGCDGGPGGGDKNTVWVYSYFKMPQTNP